VGVKAARAEPAFYLGEGGGTDFEFTALVGVVYKL
jgi:hypothetical protein